MDTNHRENRLRHTRNGMAKCQLNTDRDLNFVFPADSNSVNVRATEECTDSSPLDFCSEVIRNAFNGLMNMQRCTLCPVGQSTEGELFHVVFGLLIN